MNDRSASSSPILEVRAGKSMNRFFMCLYFVFLIGLPWLGWEAFGAGAAGDTTTNGNSIWAFWAMRLVLFSMWISAFLGIKRSLDFLRYLPILFTFDKIGIKGRRGKKIPWGEFERAFYIRQNGSLHLNVRPRTQYENIVIKSEEVGFDAIGEVESFIRKYAPHLGQQL